MYPFVPSFHSQTLFPFPFLFPGGDDSETNVFWANGEDGLSFPHPAMIYTYSLWQVLAPISNLSSWPGSFPQSLSPLPSEPSTLYCKLPASCTAQEFENWAVGCDASMGHSGVLVKYLLALNSQIPLSSRIPEEGVFRLDRSLPSPPAHT